MQNRPITKAAQTAEPSEAQTGTETVNFAPKTYSRLDTLRTTLRVFGIAGAALAVFWLLELALS